MNILYIQPTSEFGGAERIVFDWIRHSQFRSVAIVAGEGYFSALLREVGCSVYIVDAWRPHTVVKLLPLVVEIAKRERIDLIHSCSYDGHVLGGLLRLKTRIKEIWFNHGPVEKKARSRFARFLPSDALLVASKSMAKSQRETGYWAQTLQVVSLGVDLSSFKPNRERRQSNRERLGIGNKICVAVFARFDPVKGHDVLLSALTQLHRQAQSPEFKVLLVGEAPAHQAATDYFQRVQSMIRDSGFSDDCILTGFQADVAGLMDAADIVVVPSTVPEGFGLALVEAMAMGKVVVASDQGGMTDIVDHGRDGILFPMGNHDALAKSLGSIMAAWNGGGGQWDKMGEAARDTALRRFGVETACRRMDGIYRATIRNCQRSDIPPQTPAT